jgi:hypothetical protein
LAVEKPTGKGASKRVGLPKSLPRESAPLSTPFSGPTSSELPTDLSALASILEAAMTTDTPPSRPERRSEARPRVNSQLPTPNSQYPTSNSDAAEDLVVESPPARRAGEASEREAAAFDEVARSLAAAEACVPLLAQSTGLLRLAALDVVRAETARAGGLLQLLRFLRGDVSLAVTAVSTSAVVQRVVQTLESERRLRSILLTSRSSVADATIAGDETLLVNTLLTLLLITFAAVDSVQSARVMLSVTVSEAGEIGLAVSQDHVSAPAAWTTRAGSHESNADASQAVAAIALNATHRLAREWHGRFAVASGEHSTILTIWLPTLQPEDLGPVPH